MDIETETPATADAALRYAEAVGRDGDLLSAEVRALREELAALKKALAACAGLQVEIT